MGTFFSQERLGISLVWFEKVERSSTKKLMFFSKVRDAQNAFVKFVTTVGPGTRTTNQTWLCQWLLNDFHFLPQYAYLSVCKHCRLALVLNLTIDRLRRLSATTDRRCKICFLTNVAVAVRSGSFVYDMQLSLDEWVPTKDELRILSAEFVKICRQHLPFHRLEVQAEVAEEIFSYNPFKSSQIPDIANSSPGEPYTPFSLKK